MDLSAYIRNARLQCEELIEELEELGLDQLSDDCRAAGKQQIRLYFYESWKPMTEYAGLQPARRRSYRAKTDLDDRNWAAFVLGALHHLQCGLALMYAAEDAALGRGGPYRAASQRAAESANRMLGEWPPLWPFEDVPDPFDDEAS